jgi:hypothetical protein
MFLIPSCSHGQSAIREVSSNCSRLAKANTRNLSFKNKSLCLIEGRRSRTSTDKTNTFQAIPISQNIISKIGFSVVFLLFSSTIILMLGGKIQEHWIQKVSQTQHYSISLFRSSFFVRMCFENTIKILIFIK